MLTTEKNIAARTRYFFPYPFLDLEFFYLFFKFHFENLSKFIIFQMRM